MRIGLVKPGLIRDHPKAGRGRQPEGGRRFFTPRRCPMTVTETRRLPILLLEAVTKIFNTEGVMATSELERMLDDWAMAWSSSNSYDPERILALLSTTVFSRTLPSAWSLAVKRNFETGRPHAVAIRDQLPGVECEGTIKDAARMLHR